MRYKVLVSLLAILLLAFWLLPPAFPTRSVSGRVGEARPFGRQDMYPQNEEPAVAIKALFSQDRIRPGDQFRLAIVFEIAEGYHIYGPEEKQGTPLKVTLQATEGLDIGNLIYSPWVEKLVPSEVEGKDEVLDTVLSLYFEKAIVVVPIQAMDNLPTGEKEIKMKVSYGACTDALCLPATIDRSVTARIEVASKGASVNFINQDIFKEVQASSDAIPNGIPPLWGSRPETPDGVEGSGITDKIDPFTKVLKRGLFWALLVVFFGGILASLTPCVYPMIPITLAYFGSQTHQSRTKIILMSLIYVMGIAISYSTLGLIAALSGSAFGSFLGSPYVMTAMALFFAILGLSMFGVFEFTLPYFITSKLSTGKRGFLGALFMGLLLGVIAAPCVGPILVGILAWISKEGNPFLGFSFLFAFALGMGMLFIFLAIFSHTLNALPKSGTWMIGVKKLFGVLLFAAAVYFISSQIPIELTSIIIGLLLALFAIHLFWSWKRGGMRPPDRRAGRKSAWLSLGLGIVSIGLALFFTLGLLIPKGKGFATPLELLTKESKVKWVYSEKEGLEIARREKKPVIIDFYADWCISCKTMDVTTFADERVVKELRRFVAIKLDCTKSGGLNETILTKKYGFKGLPSFAFYDLSGNYLKEKSFSHKIDAQRLLEILKEIK